MNGIHKDFLYICWLVARKTNSKGLVQIGTLFTQYINSFSKIQPNTNYIQTYVDVVDPGVRAHLFQVSALPLGPLGRTLNVRD